MKEEVIKIVPKIWGGEIWLVNNKKYCGKLLLLNNKASGSIHYHKNKQETFWCLFGSLRLMVKNKSFDLTSFSKGITVMPGEKHKFEGLSKSIILEVSTTHRENDLYRDEISKEGENSWEL